MVTTAKLAALLVPMLMSSVSLCFARPSSDSRVYGNRHGPASSGYVEPSSRDLDIGFTVGGDDDVIHTSGGPIRSGHVAREGDRDRGLQDFNIGVFTDRPVPMYATSGMADGGGWSYYPRYTSSGVAEGGRDEPGGGPGFYPRYSSSGVAEGGGRGFYPRYTSSGTAEGGRDEPAGGPGFYPTGDSDEFPGVIRQPLDYKVGELKLRSDKGYQLSMHVPPSSVGDRPGVLKIDMKATLYRPIYY